jgi:hypothetical protein
MGMQHHLGGVFTVISARIKLAPGDDLKRPGSLVETGTFNRPQRYPKIGLAYASSENLRGCDEHQRRPSDAAVD